MKTIAFHFDYISPYAYIAWTQIHDLAARYQARVEPKPTLLAGLLQAAGTKGPAEIPSKRSYVGLDCIRTAKILKLPFEPPPTHPFNPLLALRVSCIEMPNDKRSALISALYRATWGGQELSLENPEAVARIANEVGLSGPDLVAQASQTEIKSRLRKNTDDAIAAGAFGVPTMLIDGEMFWGYSSFDHLERSLRGEDLLSNQDLEKWHNTQPSAVRKNA